jgi:[ribosomal protein S5]-alanine N-acetyltransferase
MQDTHIIFETERLSVRRYTSSDGDNIFSLGGNEDVMRYIRATQTKEQSDVFLLYNMNFYKEQPTMGRWAVVEKTSGKFVGSFAVIFIEETKLIQLHCCHRCGAKAMQPNLLKPVCNMFLKK